MSAASEYERLLGELQRCTHPMESARLAVRVYEAALEAYGPAALPGLVRGVPRPKYTIGQEVWLADVDSKTVQVTCPDCLGTSTWKVVTPGGSELTAACDRCSTFSSALPKPHRKLTDSIMDDLITGLDEAFALLEEDDEQLMLVDFKERVANARMTALSRRAKEVVL